MARPKSDIEERIRAAACARFSSEGVDGASLRAIASDAGTNIGMVYYYFPTKDELFFGVVEPLYQKLLDDVARALASDAPVRERVERLYRRVAQLSEEELQVMRLVLREMLISGARLARLRERFQSGHIVGLARLVADGYACGAFARPLHPMVGLLAVAGMGVLPQLLRRVLGEQLPFPGAPAGEELSRVLVEVLFSGTRGAAEK